MSSLEPKGTAEDYLVGDLLSRMSAAGVVVGAAEAGIGQVVGDIPGEQLYYFSKGAACSSVAAGSAESCHEARREGRRVRFGYRQSEGFEWVERWAYLALEVGQQPSLSLEVAHMGLALELK